METKTTVFDVAKYILIKTGRITTMKLQKLVYYAQAWSLVWDEKPLFNEKIEAWANGPVVKKLYDAHKGLYFITKSNIIKGDISKLSKESKETIDIVVENYGKLAAFQLIELTHSEMPWQKARGKCKPGEPCATVISNSDIAEYYASINVA